jgi:hypothetical protein
VKPIRDAETPPGYESGYIEVQAVMTYAKINPVQRKEGALAPYHVRKFNAGKKCFFDGSLNEV